MELTDIWEAEKSCVKCHACVTKAFWAESHGHMNKILHASTYSREGGKMKKGT